MSVEKTCKQSSKEKMPKIKQFDQSQYFGGDLIIFAKT